MRVNSVDPRATRTAMRAQAIPGENPESLPHPSVIAENILQLASPSLTQTGGLFDAREEKWKSQTDLESIPERTAENAASFGKHKANKPR